MHVILDLMRLEATMAQTISISEHEAEIECIEMLPSPSYDEAWVSHLVKAEVSYSQPSLLYWGRASPSIEKAAPEG